MGYGPLTLYYPYLCPLMALYITSLNSGSNGNCYYIGNSNEAVLIDAGISCRETEKRMKGLGLSMNNLKAIFVSHEHTDHIKGVSTLANKYSLPVYITPLTARHGPQLIRHLSRTFTENEPVTVGELRITPFTKQHDAVDPYSFVVSYNDITVGVFTDIGKPCRQVTHYFNQCHAAFLETNYDEVMLENGHYPAHLKARIRGDQGHLSNTQALELLNSYRSPNLTHLLLSHLSKENNRPELVEELFVQHAKGASIIVAGRYAATDVFSITSNGTKGERIPRTAAKPLQLGLFQ
jgi:phosphoribosyl 1,2-cyclic phosphodiesterase